jgi:hypothetical protein
MKNNSRFQFHKFHQDREGWGNPDFVAAGACSLRGAGKGAGAVVEIV